MTHLAIREWEKVPVKSEGSMPGESGFTRSQANLLMAAVKPHSLGRDDGGDALADHYKYLRAKQKVGVISAKGCSLEILPKISGETELSKPEVRLKLVRMIETALGLRISTGNSAQMAVQNNSILEVLIATFATELLAKARRGLPRSYLPHEGNLTAIRGKLNIIEQFTKNVTRSDQLACQFDELSTDRPLLQIMKACVRLLRKHTNQDRSQRKLDELVYHLSDVSNVQASALPWGQVKIDRTNRDWESLFELAQLFLKQEWQATHRDPDARDGMTLLFPMNDLFEAYIAALARRAFRLRTETVHAQGGMRFCLTECSPEGRQRFQTKPDILIKRGKDFKTILDTKWKRVNDFQRDQKNGVSQADVYQMMAYARLYDCPKLILLYPRDHRSAKATFSKKYEMRGGDVAEQLLVATVDITKTEDQICKQILELAA